MHNLLYMDVTFIYFSFYLLQYYLGIFDINYIIHTNVVVLNFIFKEKKVWRKVRSLLKYLNIFYS